jgi:hypothetical protein
VAGQRHATAAALHSPGLIEPPHPAVWGDPPAGCAEHYVTRFGAREPGA